MAANDAVLPPNERSQRKLEDSGSSLKKNICLLDNHSRVFCVSAICNKTFQSVFTKHILATNLPKISVEYPSPMTASQDHPSQSLRLAALFLAFLASLPS